MPPPKRPFTTSSLTSTLKSTIANQPLLSNFTSIDKLSSQASSLAQKTPFFGAIQPQQHDNVHNNSGPTSTTSTTTSIANPNMMRGNPGGTQQLGNGGLHHQQQQQQPTQQRQALATTPTVDMSHLTEEERLMIQSVMAKAEMADMGIPVDTSAPSSTNLPSNASQALVQQQQQHQQQAKQQQLANQMVAHDNQQQSQPHQQRPQQQQQLQQQHQQSGMGQTGNQHDFMQQQQAQINMMHPNQGPSPNFQGHQQNVNHGPSFNQNQQQFQQPQNHQKQSYQQNMQNQPLNQQANLIGPQQPVCQASVSDAHSAIDTRTTVPSLEQQTQQLVNQINTQFYLNQNQSQPSSSAQRNIPGQQSSSTGQFGYFDKAQTNARQPPQQQQQQQQQVQSQLQGQSQQQNMLDQQMRLQQLSNLDNFDRTLIAPSQSVGVSSSVNSQQQMSNPMMGQQYPSSEQRYIQQQQQLQQQQLQEQAQLNLLINDQQSRLMQPNKQRSQLELESANVDPMLIGQLVDPMQQQQSIANNYQVNNPAPILQRLNTQQTGLKVLDPQMNPLDATLGPNFIQPQQPSEIPSLMDPMSQRMISSSNFSTSAINSQPNQQIMSFNDESRPRQTPYNALCSEIRFGPQTSSFDHQELQNDHALSDQEYGHTSRSHHNNLDRHGIRRNESLDPTENRVRSKFVNIREPLEVRERKLQAYDLAQRKDLNRHSSGKPSRQLPRPNQPLHDQQILLSSPSEQSHECQITNRSKEKPSSRKSNRKDFDQDSPRYLSESDDEVAEGKMKNSNIETSARKPANSSTKDVVDKNEEAIRVLSELKLTEQANQVMEQQQLLIKQSQELIKLQLEQQALSQELKKSIKQTTSSSNDSAEHNKKSQNNFDEKEEDSKNQHQANSQSQKTDSEDTTKSPKIFSNGRDKTEYEEENLPASSIKKSTLFYHDSDPDSPRTSSKAGTRFNETIADNLTRDKVFGKSNDRDTRIGGKASHLYHQNSTNSSSQTGPSLRYNRDLLQSPTDTTDSDVEPLSRSQDSRRQHKINNQQASKPKSVMRRREPTGLPPSPLPVAAAIQLHQMQQQHYRQQINPTNVRGASSARNNFMRSRSVTSSPSYHLENGSNSGYLTDNQRNRSASPDTLSEFGGQRRRKRLPEPPTNTIPITPSMVRKMIQAQRAGSAASGKLLTSVNVHSTLLTNTHSTRNLAFERPPHNHDNTSANYSRTSTSNNNEPYSSLNQPIRQAQTSVTSTSQPPASNVNIINSQHPNPASGASDLNKFLSSTYGNSILRNNISDIKETPELDKLISNLDDYYGLDTTKRHNRSFISHSSPDAQIATDTYNQTSITGPSLLSSLSTASPTRAHYSMNPSSSNYTNVKSIYPGFSNYSTRRSSEGESNLARLTARRPYRQANLDEGYRNYGRNFTSSSYLEGRNPPSYLNSSSPVRQLRYANQFSASDRLTRDCPSTSFGDNYLGSSGGTNKFDRTTSQNYRPTSNQFLANSRLHTNPTGSLDFENLDYLAPSTNERAISQSTELSDVLSRSGERYRHRFTNANPYIDSTIDKYRYSGFDDLRVDRSDFSNPTPRYQTSGLISNEFNGPRRSHMISHLTSNHPQHKSFDLDTGSAYHSLRTNLSPFETRPRDLRSNQYTDSIIDSNNYVNDLIGRDSSALINTRTEYSPQTGYTDTLNRSDVNASSFAPLTKNDIINNGPKFNSIGYRFRTENQNKYVAQARNPIQCLQSRYPHPYKRILLSKNPKDRIGNGIGVRITGGQPIPNLYDKVNRCIVSSGAFVTEVFHNSNVHFMGEMQEGDQIIEWNGVNLCNRSNEEVQQILLSQFSDDEVEIVYLPQNKFKSAYNEINSQSFNDRNFHDVAETGQDAFDTFADMNKSGRQSSVTPIVGGRSRYGDEVPKGSLRRKLSLSHIAHMWSK